jgi:hypothetical protein
MSFLTDAATAAPYKKRPTFDIWFKKLSTNPSEYNLGAVISTSSSILKP